MSLGLFAAIVVELERRKHERVTVEDLAVYVRVSPSEVRGVLRDIYGQGHCMLFGDSEGSPPDLLASAQWLEHPACD